MPLEIRELVIRTTINSDQSPLSNPTKVEDTSQISWSEANQAAIVAACVEQVLSILQSQSER